MPPSGQAGQLPMMPPFPGQMPPFPGQMPPIPGQMPPIPGQNGMPQPFEQIVMPQPQLQGPPPAAPPPAMQIRGYEQHDQCPVVYQRWRAAQKTYWERTGDRPPSDAKISRSLYKFDQACAYGNPRVMNQALEEYIAAGREFYGDDGQLGSERDAAYDRSSDDYDPDQGEELDSLVSAIMDCEKDMKHTLTSAENHHNSPKWGGPGPNWGGPGPNWGYYPSLARPPIGANPPIEPLQADPPIEPLHSPWRNSAGPPALEGFEERLDLVDEAEREEQDARIAQADQSKGRVLKPNELWASPPQSSNAQGK